MDITVPRAASLIRGDTINTGALLLHVLSSRLLSEVLWGEAGNYDILFLLNCLTAKRLTGAAVTMGTCHRAEPFLRN